jgi:hypothetical protein
VSRSDVYIGMVFSFGNAYLSIEPTYFSSRVSDDETQNNSQIRTALTYNYFRGNRLSLAVPVRYDISVTGPDYFENWKISLNGAYKMPLSVGSESAVLVYGGVGSQSFVNINKSSSQWNFGLKIQI